MCSLNIEMKNPSKHVIVIFFLPSFFLKKKSIINQFLIFFFKLICIGIIISCLIFYDEDSMSF
jgi:hypothetical protein